MHVPEWRTRRPRASAVRYREGGSADGRDGIRAFQRGDVPQRNGPERPPGGRNGLHHRLDLGPLPSLDRRAGREPVRMERDRGYRHRHRRDPSRHWHHLPHYAHPPGDNRPGHGDLGSDAGGLLPVLREGDPTGAPLIRRSVKIGYLDPGRRSEGAHTRLGDRPTEGRPPVVLVHGLVVSSRYMVPTLKRLAAYHRVYAPELPGFGEGEKPRRVLDVTGSRRLDEGSRAGT